MTQPADIFTDDIEILEFTSISAQITIPRLAFRLYPICQLIVLINAMKEKAPDTRTVRYLVDCDEKMWFAEEGEASAHIPVHHQMTGNPSITPRCIAAGYITLSADYKSIVMINNNGGLFKPTLDSIKWPLAILVNCLVSSSIPLQLHSELTIEQFTSGGGLQDLYILDKGDLMSWVSMVFHHINFRHQPTDVKIVLHERHPHSIRHFAVTASTDSSRIEEEAPSTADNEDDTGSVFNC